MSLHVTQAVQKRRALCEREIGLCFVDEPLNNDEVPIMRLVYSFLSQAPRGCCELYCSDFDRCRGRRSPPIRIFNTG